MISHLALQNLIQNGNVWKELLLGSAQITERCAGFLCQWCPDLEALEIDVGAFDDGVHCILALSRMQKMRRLSLNVQDDYQFTKPGYKALVQAFPSLTHLDINLCCGTDFGGVDTADEEFSLLAGLIHLKVLKVGLKNRMVGLGLMAVMKDCNRLKSFTVRHANLTYAGFRDFIPNRNLQDLQFVHCYLSSKTLEFFANACTSLQSLELRNVGISLEEVTRAAVTEVRNRIAKMYRNLRKLHMKGSDFSFGDVIVNKDDVCFPDLEELHIKHQSSYVSDGGLSKVVQKCPQLKSLHLQNVSGLISQTGLDNFIHGCKQLRSISFMLKSTHCHQHVNLNKPFSRPFVYAHKC